MRTLQVLFAISTICMSLLFSPSALAERPEGVFSEVDGVSFNAPPDTPGLLLPDPCPGPALAKTFSFGTWQRIDGVCDDFAFGAGATPCAGELTLYQEQCLYAADFEGAIASFFNRGRYQICQGAADAFACGSPGANVVSTGDASGRFRAEVGEEAGLLHAAGEASQERGRSYDFGGKTIKVKKDSFVCHSIAIPDTAENACGGGGCEFDTVCQYGARGRGGNGDDD